MVTQCLLIIVIFDLSKYNSVCKQFAHRNVWCAVEVNTQDIFNGKYNKTIQNPYSPPAKQMHTLLCAASICLHYAC